MTLLVFCFHGTIVPAAVRPPRADPPGAGKGARVPIVGQSDAEQERKDVPPRQCGRCRQMFEGDPTLHQTGLPEWWVCPPCRTALLGPDRTRTTSTAEERS